MLAVAVVCSPVVDKDTDTVMALFVVVCDPLTLEDNANLNFFENQLLVCFKRVRQSGIAPKSSRLPVINGEKPLKDESILQLCANLYDADSITLQLKLLRYITEVTKASAGFILLVDHDTNEMFCQVMGNNILVPNWRFPAGDIQSCYSRPLISNQPLQLADISQKEKQELERYLGVNIKSLLCVPLVAPIKKQVVAIMCMVNKKTCKGSFAKEDIDIINYCFQYTSSVLHSALALARAVRQQTQTQALLTIARNLFTHIDNLTTLLQEIMHEAKILTGAERCSVFLVENETNELVAKVFDGDSKTGNESTEVRIPGNQGIAGHVATTGEVLNIEDAYAHPLFYRKIDELTGFKTRNILCFPIKDRQGVVIGVAQLCNKITGSAFTKSDEDIAKTFSVYCCISIVNSLLYNTVEDAQQRSKLSNELMIYHMQVMTEDVTQLAATPIPPPTFFNEKFSQISFTPRLIAYADTPLAVLTMFEDMGFITKFRINKTFLCRFILMVRKGYRDPPYHNWHHAFAVCHFCYVMYKNLNLPNYLDDIELLALFVSCLCHDLDHRGTTNSFQIASDSVLAALYSSAGSVLERHHLTQTMCVLNTDGCNIFKSLSKANYQQVLDLISYIILATDLAHHLHIMNDLKKMTEDGYDRKKPEHHQLLISLLITACDLSDQTKDWNTAKKIAELIYQEFFKQGDLEKSLGRDPLLMMDREKACIPELQGGFLESIALPLYSILAKVFPAAKAMVAVIHNNRAMWKKMNIQVKNMTIVSRITMDNLLSTDTEDDDPGTVDSGTSTSKKNAKK
ncbi:cGMP-dependent 3',5'-cyclic phosphodiesterase [Lamellibrachia satsuma]|nr:cGMP-dependent 3',5'-cyclic phosphodiesterase [Lamellibrachia satsuma]